MSCLIKDPQSAVCSNALTFTSAAMLTELCSAHQGCLHHGGQDQSVSEACGLGVAPPPLQSPTPYGKRGFSEEDMSSIEERREETSFGQTSNFMCSKGGKHREVA
jgi:hypothetical protein